MALVQRETRKIHSIELLYPDLVTNLMRKVVKTPQKAQPKSEQDRRNWTTLFAQEPQDQDHHQVTKIEESETMKHFMK